MIHEWSSDGADAEQTLMGLNMEQELPLGTGSGTQHLPRHNHNSDQSEAGIQVM